jgi:hypothetical protein
MRLQFVQRAQVGFRRHITWLIMTKRKPLEPAAQSIMLPLGSNGCQTRQNGPQLGGRQSA